MILLVLAGAMAAAWPRVGSALVVKVREAR